MDRICLVRVILKVDLPLIINGEFHKLFKATIGSFVISLNKILHQNSFINTYKILSFHKMVTLAVRMTNKNSNKVHFGNHFSV